MAYMYNVEDFITDCVVVLSVDTYTFNAELTPTLGSTAISEKRSYEPHD